MGLSYGENFTILTSTVFLWYTRLTDGGETDGQAIAYTRYSIYVVARKNHNTTTVGHISEYSCVKKFKFCYSKCKTFCGYCKYGSIIQMLLSYSYYDYMFKTLNTGLVDKMV